jgi:hypothetical protein
MSQANIQAGNRGAPRARPVMVCSAMTAAPDFTFFETPVGLCGVLWSNGGVLGLQLPEANEVRARKCLLRRFQNAIEAVHPPAIADAINRIQVLLSGQPADLTGVSSTSHGSAVLNVRSTRSREGSHPGGRSLTVTSRLGSATRPMPRPSAARWATIPFRSWFPATGSWQPRGNSAASPQPAGRKRSCVCSRSRALPWPVRATFFGLP